MIIDGKMISAALKAEVAERVAEASVQYGRNPHLVVIRVGEDPASVVYVRNKAKACEACGIRNTTLVMDENTPEEVLLQKIAALNADPEVDGILVQLPLPRQISEAKVIAALLGCPFIDAKNCIFFNDAGELDAKRTYETLPKLLPKEGRAVIPGFYGVRPDGSVCHIVEFDPQTGARVREQGRELCARGAISVIGAHLI